MRERKIVKQKYGDIEVERVYLKGLYPATREELANMPEEEREKYALYAPFQQRTYFPEPGILCEQDIAVKMRDGTVIYADIFRPEGENDLPCIISWSYYGKRPSYKFGEKGRKIEGVPLGTVSGMAKFESADPGFWCRYGYAVANVDPRGVGHSEGNVELFNSQDAKDGYDFIEWVTRQVWSNGKAALSGDSCLAMTQWRIAAQQPPHLVCICPWEGTSDMFRESLFEGGILGEFSKGISLNVCSKNYVDDQYETAKLNPYADSPYWKDTNPDFSKITVPAYVTASWSHFHLRGSILGFMKISSPNKRLRCHREFEWPDAYSHWNLADQKLFFDRYLKDIHNGWELTPKVRIDVMDAFDCDFQPNRPENEFPLSRTQYKKLYLDADSNGMSRIPVNGISKVSYDGETGCANFDFQFEEDTELTGFMKLHLWVQAEGNDDMDLFVNIQKLSSKGEWLPTWVLSRPHPGAWGKLRVSRRKLDQTLSTDYEPFYAHTCDEKLSAGEIVPVDIEVWPHSRIWHKGQYLRVQVSGHYARKDWFENLTWQTNNRGQHIIHTGGKYDSYLQIPVIPPKYADGDYVYR